MTAGPRGRSEKPSVIIIGGGLGGIAAAVNLKKAGLHAFTIFERSAGPGGVWWDNRYPGVEVDVSSHLYSYSFKRFDWSRTHADQAELQRYLEEVIDDFDLRSHFRFETKVERVEWDGSRGYYVWTSDGDEHYCRAVISAVGLLNEPRFPDWPGLAGFEGPIFHSARWDPHVELAGKTVAVVGTGSTAAQIVPAIAEEAKQVTLFQREPGWIFPKGDRVFSEEERAILSGNWAHRRERLRLFWQIERGQFFGSIHRPGTKLNSLRERQAREYIAHAFKDRPDLQEAVTPRYPYAGKRPVLSSSFYPSLLRNNVTLVPHAVTSVSPTAVIDASGTEHRADVLILATGFQPTNFLVTFDIVGRGGRSLREMWGSDPQAFLGITVPAFPNFFMLYGPNTNGGEIVSQLERQAEYAVRTIWQLRNRRIDAIEVRPWFYEIYNEWLQRAIAKTSWVVSNNYYKSESGRVVTQWPYGAVIYRVLSKLLRRPSQSIELSKESHQGRRNIGRVKVLFPLDRRNATEL